MTTKLSIKEQIVLVSSTLLLALWAPTTVLGQSQESMEPSMHPVASHQEECVHCKLFRSSAGKPCPHGHFQNVTGTGNAGGRLGFAETDPSAYFSGLTVHATSNDRESAEYAGFAEVDPTGPIILEAVENSGLASREVAQNPIGFAEQELSVTSVSRTIVPSDMLLNCRHLGPSSQFSAPGGHS